MRSPRQKTRTKNVSQIKKLTKKVKERTPRSRLIFLMTGNGGLPIKNRDKCRFSTCLALATMWKCMKDINAQAIKKYKIDNWIFPLNITKSRGSTNNYRLECIYGESTNPITASFYETVSTSDVWRMTRKNSKLKQNARKFLFSIHNPNYLDAISNIKIEAIREIPTTDPLYKMKRRSACVCGPDLSCFFISCSHNKRQWNCMKCV